MWNAVNIKTFERYDFEKIGFLEVFLLHYLIAKAAYFGNNFYYPDSRITQEVGLSKHQIHLARKKLIELDFIHVERGIQSKLQYWINLDGMYQKAGQLIKPEHRVKFVSELAELNAIYKKKKDKIKN